MNGLGLRHPAGGFLNSLNTRLSPTCLRAARMSTARHTTSAAVVMARVHHDVSSIHTAPVITTMAGAAVWNLFGTNPFTCSAESE